VTAAHGRGASRASRAQGDDDLLSLQEAADALGVHYMTAYRYVRTGRLAATQIGSAWQVRRASLAAIAPPEHAGRAKLGAATRRRHYDRHLNELLLKGDEAEAWRLTQQALGSAYSPEDLYLDVLGPALRQVGDDWAADRVTVAEEHRASALTSRLIGRLGPLFIRRGRSRGTVVLGALEGDYHALASAIVADVLRGRGFAVADLGANTPSQSFVETIGAAERLVAIGIVVSAPLRDRAIRTAISAIKDESESPLLLGGLTIRDAQHARRLGADGWTGSSRAAADWFEGKK